MFAITSRSYARVFIDHCLCSGYPFACVPVHIPFLWFWFRDRSFTRTSFLWRRLKYFNFALPLSQFTAVYSHRLLPLLRSNSFIGSATILHYSLFICLSTRRPQRPSSWFLWTKCCTKCAIGISESLLNGFWSPTYEWEEKKGLAETYHMLFAQVIIETTKAII